MISVSRSTANQPHSSFIDFCSCKPTAGSVRLCILDTLKEISRARCAAEVLITNDPHSCLTCAVLLEFAFAWRTIKTRKVVESLIPRAGNGEKSLAHQLVSRRRLVTSELSYTNKEQLRRRWRAEQKTLFDEFKFYLKKAFFYQDTSVVT